MSANPRPLSVTILGGLYLAIGLAGLASHSMEVWADHAFRFDGLVVELISLLAAIAGIFMLLGHNWARWLALAWMASHVIISAFNKWPEFAIHCVFFVVIAWLLLRPEVKRYFSASVV